MRTILMTVAVALLCGLATPAVAADDAPRVGARPGGDSQGTGYFLIDTEPGARHDLEIVIDSDVATAVQVVTVDATTGPAGLMYDPERSTGRVSDWIEIADSTVHVVSGQPRQVDVTLQIPETARSGDHVAGLAVGPTGPGHQDGPVQFRSETVIAVHVRVGQPDDVALDIDSVELSQVRHDRATIDIQFTNGGARLLAGAGTLTVGSEPADVTLGAFHPEDTVTLQVPWGSLEAGTYPADLEVRYGLHDGRRTETVRWSGTITVDEAAAAAVTVEQELLPDVPHGAFPVWLIVVAVVMFIVALLLGLLLGRRQRDRDDDGPDEHRSSPVTFTASRRSGSFVR